MHIDDITKITLDMPRGQKLTFEKGEFYFESCTISNRWRDQVTKNMRMGKPKDCTGNFLSTAFAFGDYEFQSEKKKFMVRHNPSETTLYRLE